MKYALVDSQATVHFRYLVALEDNQSLEDAKGRVVGNELDDLVQCWDEEVVGNAFYATDEDILKTVEGSYMGAWGVAQIKEVMCILPKPNDTSEK
jgi:hypothetical protein